MPSRRQASPDYVYPAWIADLGAGTGFRQKHRPKPDLTSYQSPLGIALLLQVLVFLAVSGGLVRPDHSMAVEQWLDLRHAEQVSPGINLDGQINS